MGTWGGRRPGAGRPRGTYKKQSAQRERRQVRAFADEWELIRRFSIYVKYGDKAACKRALAKLGDTMVFCVNAKKLL